MRIGSPAESDAHRFKNLKDVEIDFDQSEWVTVLIGWNGTGKSNVMEALATLFRDLIMGRRTPAFAYQLDYEMGSGSERRRISIDADPDRKRDPYRIRIEEIPNEDAGAPHDALAGRKVSLTAFLREDERNLPEHVFAYYSGESPRMREIFRPYLERYDRDLRSGKQRGLKRLFYALPVHSQFVLLAFLIGQSTEARSFLRTQLGIDPDDGVESILFVLQQPPWAYSAPDGDPRFWNARGVVRDFLNRLQDAALAPVSAMRNEPVSLWNKKKLGFKYLFLKNVEALRSLVGSQTAVDFFRDLESTHVSQLIDSVRIRIRLSDGRGTVTFSELSEGEQQLLTVLGLLRFTAGSETLFLLDEPDTHLNPAWSVNFLQLLRDYGGHPDVDRRTSHVLVTTHNPLAIAELQREQVQILRRSSVGVIASRPAEHPRGMGFASIVTSDMFGLGSSLDVPTMTDVLRLHRLATAEIISSEEAHELDALRKRLQKLDFNFAARDPIEQAFLRARFDMATEADVDDPVVTPENKRLALEVLVKALLHDVRIEER